MICSLHLDNSESVWLGGSDEHHEGLRLWVDGRQVDIYNNFWSKDSPRICSSTNCILAQKTTSSYTVTKTWLTDAKCSYENNFICQIYG